MSITYGGVGLRHPTDDILGRWDRWRDRHAQEPVLPRGFLAPGLDHLPVPAFSDHLYRHTHLNRLVWPTGASRWAVFHALASQEQLTAVYAASTAAGNPLELVVGESADPARGGRLATAMHLLPPRPVFDGLALADPLYLLTLVDERWYWWQAASGTPPDAASWSALLTGLLAAVGVGSPTIDTIHADYATPQDARWSGLTYKPLPVLIDAAAESCGCRVVRALDGTVRVLSGANARTREDDNWEANKRWLEVGGRTPVENFGPSLPEKVTVVFPGTPPAAADVTLAATGVFPGVTGRAGRAGVLHADLAADEPAPARTACAAVAAADWYRWAVGRVDAVFGGVCPWPGGLEDRAEYEWLPPLADAPERLLTRVVPWPAWDRNRYGGPGPGAVGSGSGSGAGDSACCCDLTTVRFDVVTNVTCTDGALVVTRERVSVTGCSLSVSTGDVPTSPPPPPPPAGDWYCVTITGLGYATGSPPPDCDSGGTYPYDMTAQLPGGPGANPYVVSGANIGLPEERACYFTYTVVSGPHATEAAAAAACGGP